MAMVVRVRFRRTTKLYDFETNNLQVSCGDQVLTETVRGVEIGECMTDPEPLMDEQRAALLKLECIVRKRRTRRTKRQSIRDMQELRVPPGWRLAPFYIRCSD